MLNKLSPAFAAKSKEPGRHSDGGGLYLSIDADGRRRWTFMFTRNGRRSELGLGSGRDMSLADARSLAAEMRAVLERGGDPRSVRKKGRQGVTFGEFADAYIETMRPSWRNWNEIDLEKQVWTIPKARMKAGKEHRVPLSNRAVEIVEASRAEQAKLLEAPSQFVFARGRDGKPLSSMAMMMLLRRIQGQKSHTVHGFRSSFRDWAAEVSYFPHEVCEMALAHTIGNKAEAAYRRGDLFEKRRQLMQAWADYCG